MQRRILVALTPEEAAWPKRRGRMLRHIADGGPGENNRDLFGHDMSEDNHVQNNLAMAGFCKVFGLPDLPVPTRKGFNSVVLPKVRVQGLHRDYHLCIRQNTLNDMNNVLTWVDGLDIEIVGHIGTVEGRSLGVVEGKGHLVPPERLRCITELMTDLGLELVHGDWLHVG